MHCTWPLMHYDELSTNLMNRQKIPSFFKLMSLYMLPVKMPVMPSIKYLNHVFPELGYEAKANGGKGWNSVENGFAKVTLKFLQSLS